jgi:hypothetical protein
VVDLAGRIVSLVGRFARVPNALVAKEVERRGGIVRRGLPQRTALVAFGRRSLAFADGRLQAKLARAERIGALCLSENALLRILDLLPPLPAGAGAVRLDELPERTGLDPLVVRLLVLYDVVQPCGTECSFRDLIAAREVARLLGEGLTVADIVRSAERLGRAGGGANDHPLARLKLVCDDSGRLARRIGDAFAELDGQLRLALPYADNPSVDEVFDAAEEAEQAGDLTTAAMLYRRCVSMDQRDPIAPFNLANVLREQGQHGRAKLFLELALAIDPEFADAWYNLGLLREAAGDRQGARRCLERAIAADPDYADPVYNLARLQFELGCFAEASRLWQRYLTLDPDSEWSRRARSGLHLCQHHGKPGTG